MKTLMIAAALCVGMMSAQAQTTPTDTKTTPTENKGTATTPAAQKPAQHTSKNCLSATDADRKSLGLNADQQTKVPAIQAECKKECAAKKDGDASTAMIADKHEMRIKEVLTPAQHEAWMNWCTAQATPAKPMEKK